MRMGAIHFGEKMGRQQLSWTSRADSTSFMMSANHWDEARIVAMWEEAREDPRYLLEDDLELCSLR